jgi:phenylalanyl-tRNA synthetase beta chain
MRPAMLPTALEVITFNLNRKNSNIKFFEWGKTYNAKGEGNYAEQDHCCIYLTGNRTESSWQAKAAASDIYFLKGVVEALLQSAGLKASFEKYDSTFFDAAIAGTINGRQVVQVGKLAKKTITAFDIKQPVFFADIDWNAFLAAAAKVKTGYREIPKFPAVERDLALVVPKSMHYEAITGQLNKLRLNKLQDVRLFDVFESEKLGAGKKSMAINFTFLDEEKTLTDKEIDSWMQKIMNTLEQELGAEVRK